MCVFFFGGGGGKGTLGHRSVGDSDGRDVCVCVRERERERERENSELYYPRIERERQTDRERERERERETAHLILAASQNEPLELIMAPRCVSTVVQTFYRSPKKSIS